MTTFFLGTHMPHWLGLLDIPLFVSRNRLMDREKGTLRKTLPRARGPWALDSGGFTELQRHGRWTVSPERYVADVRRIADEVGNLQWAAPQDWMCEPIVISGGQAGPNTFHGTGLSVEEHQRRTVVNFLHLRDLAPDLPFVPVIQGYALDDYLRCIDLYQRLGVDLTAERTVGIGSVCRRENTGEIALITSTIAAQGIRLHGFGVKSGLEEYGEHLTSADSMAWSFRGRRVRPCAHGPAKSEANCMTFALCRREQLLARMAAGFARPQQLALDLFGVAA